MVFGATVLLVRMFESYQNATKASVLRAAWLERCIRKLVQCHAIVRLRLALPVAQKNGGIQGYIGYTP